MVFRMFAFVYSVETDSDSDFVISPPVARLSSLSVTTPSHETTICGGDGIALSVSLLRHHLGRVQRMLLKCLHCHRCCNDSIGSIAWEVHCSTGDVVSGRRHALSMGMSYGERSAGIS